MKVRCAPVGAVVMALALGACATSMSYPRVAALRYETTVEYTHVDGLVAASENVRIPLGPGRSYWFNAPDGSRWAADDPIIPSSTKVIIWHEGAGLIATNGPMQTIRHVSGPREVSKGWYGRVIETRSAVQGIADATTEDGRRFTVTAQSRGSLPGLPFEVVVSEDGTRIFVLSNGVELVVTPLP